MTNDLRPHITLVLEKYQYLTSCLPRIAWEPWVHLMAEAQRNADLQGLERTHRIEQLELWLVASNAVDGWKADLLVKGMAGENPPKSMPAAAFITTQPQELNGDDKKRKRGLLERVRG